MINVIRHLLPKSRAWDPSGGKLLTRFFEALAPLGEDTRKFIDETYLELWPSTTTDLDAWEEQHGITKVTASDETRRTKIAAAWRNVGGQSPAYIESVLRSNGFDVHVHEWWEDTPAVGYDEAAIPRNPLSVLSPEYLGVVPGVDCGEDLAQCGEDWALCGNTAAGLVGYPLVNKFEYNSDLVGYTVPTDPKYWPYFMYVGGPFFGDVATVPAARRFEFEELLLKIRPAQQWIGVIVRYT